MDLNKYGCTIDQSDNPLTIEGIPFCIRTAAVIQCSYLMCQFICESSRFQEGASIGYIKDDMLYEEA
ncbi:MAG: hypothetical protein WC516_10120 [Patescibacteria group bacterium]